MRILVIGGTYFLGRAFTDMAVRDNEVCLINRGNAPYSLPQGVSAPGRVREFHADRHDAAALSALSSEDDIRKGYDVIVDFCAYQEGDISFLLDNLRADCGRYILISTVDVYRRGSKELLSEDAPYEDRDFGGEAGDYIKGKIGVEKELKGSDIPYTILRPSFIYGPGNYAPREGIYFNWLLQAGSIIHPSDATGVFQLAYVDDVAGAVLKACDITVGRYSCYNLCPGELLDYESFAEALRMAADTDFERAELSVAEILERGIPLPFPLRSEESGRYDGRKAERELGASFRSAVEGLGSAFRYYVKTSDNR